MLKTVICIGFLLIKIQISSAKTPRYTGSNIVLWATYQHAEACVADVVKNINSDIKEATRVLKEKCEEELKKSDEFGVVIDSLKQLVNFNLGQSDKMIALIQSCNDTHCPPDVKEQGKQITDDLHEAVRNTYDDGIDILNNNLPGTKCAPYLKCVEKYALCFQVYEFYNYCFEDVNPVFQSKYDTKSSKSLKGRFGTKLFKKAKHDKLVAKEMRIGFENVYNRYSNATRLKGTKIKASQLQDLEDFNTVKPNLPSDPNVEGCDKLPSNKIDGCKKVLGTTVYIENQSLFGEGTRFYK